MKARKTRAKKRGPKSAAPAPKGKLLSEGGTMDRWGNDLSTVEGSKANQQEFNRRKAIAEDFHLEKFAEIAGHVDQIGKLVMSVLTDLTDLDMRDTTFEVARIAKEAFVVGLLVSSGAEEAVSS